MCDENRITNEEFCRKLELLNSKSNKSDQSLQQCAKQSNSKIDGQFGGQESWGKDSGARDLSPADLQPHPLMPINNDEMVSNKLQKSALSTLKKEVEDLTFRLQQSEHEKEIIQKECNENLTEKEILERRLQNVLSSNESRMTELHCVIAELSKKLKVRQENAFIEETENDVESVSDLSFLQEPSIYNSEYEGENFDAESRKSEIIDTKFDQIDNSVLRKDETKIQSLQEEIIHLRVQVALLQSQLATEVENQSKDIIDEADTSVKDESRDEDDEDLSEFLAHKTAKNVKTSSMDLQKATDLYPIRTNKISHEVPVAKMAARVRLRRTVEEHHLTGLDITTSGIHTTEIAEHLVSDLLQSDTQLSNLNEVTSNEQYLQRRIEHLRFQNSAISLTLMESKAHCEKLYLLCGKYESNAVSLALCLHYLDRAIEGYDVLLAIVESRVAQLQGDKRSEQDRLDAETVGKNLLSRFKHEHNFSANSFSVGPWQELDGICTIKNTQTPWTNQDYISLQGVVSKFKGLREQVQNTSVILERPFYDSSADSETKEVSSGLQRDNRRMDLETAVLMQELMSLREDVSELKLRAEKQEHAKLDSELKYKSLQDAFTYLKAQLDDAEALLAIANKNRPSYSEAEHTTGIERELVEALARESRLKARLQCISTALDTTTKSSESKYSQLQNAVVELRLVNTNLKSSLDRCKKRYHSRLKELEQQLLGGKFTNPQGSSHRSEVPETSL